MEASHNSNTSDDMIPNNLLGFTNEALDEMFNKVDEQVVQVQTPVQVQQPVQRPPLRQIQPPKQGILKQGPPAPKPVMRAPVVKIQEQPAPEPVNSNPETDLLEVVPSTEPATPVAQTPALTPSNQYLKVMNFEISKTTLMFAVGLVALVGGYYYMQRKNVPKKEEQPNKIRRGRGVRDQYQE